MLSKACPITLNAILVEASQIRQMPTWAACSHPKRKHEQNCTRQYDNIKYMFGTVLCLYLMSNVKSGP